MKFLCTQFDLNEALNIVCKAVIPNSTLPVLNNILIKAEGDNVYFSSTNLEIAIKCFIKADVRSEGSITIPAKLISGYISFLKDKNVEVALIDGNTILISSKSSQTKIKGINSNEFPSIPNVPKENYFKVPVLDINSAILQTVFSVSMNTSRPVLSGILFDIDKDTLKIVATDSYRLAEKTILLKEKTSICVQSIIPSRTITELGRIVSRIKSSDVEINITKNQALFRIGNVELISRLIEGKFPDYKKIIPKSCKTSVDVKTEDFATVVKRVSLFVKEDSNNINIAVTNDGKILVSTGETRVGEEHAEIDAVVHGDNNKITLKVHYIIDILTFIQSEKVVFSIDDQLSPAVFRPLGAKDYVYIIMPIRV